MLSSASGVRGAAIAVTGKSVEDDAGCPSGVCGINSDNGDDEYKGGTIGVCGMPTGECGSSVGDVTDKGSATAGAE